MKKREQNIEESLSFIKTADLVQLVQSVVDKMSHAAIEIEKNPHKNVIDPFSSIFEALFFNINLSEWMKREKMRQVQKSLQNAIGNFHQGILGHVDGWEDLKVGHVADLVNHRMKMIAEIKNKYNTTKGSDRVRVYDGLASVLGKPEYRGYTGYYVEIIPKQSQRRNHPFTPPDNTTKTQRIANDSIRQVDGASFYTIATGREDALKELYVVLPSIIAQCCQSAFQYAELDPAFYELFERAFGVDK